MNYRIKQEFDRPDLLKTELKILYQEYIDFESHFEYEADWDVQDDRTLYSYSFRKNTSGDIVPILVFNDQSYYSADFQDYYIYVGTSTVDGTLYDKWQKVEVDNEYFRIGLDTTVTAFIYTNIVVEEGTPHNYLYIDSNLTLTGCITDTLYPAQFILYRIPEYDESIWPQPDAELISLLSFTTDPANNTLGLPYISDLSNINVSLGAWKESFSDDGIYYLSITLGDTDTTWNVQSNAVEVSIESLPFDEPKPIVTLSLSDDLILTGSASSNGNEDYEIDLHIFKDNQDPSTITNDSMGDWYHCGSGYDHPDEDFEYFNNLLANGIDLKNLDSLFSENYGGSLEIEDGSTYTAAICFYEYVSSPTTSKPSAVVSNPVAYSSSAKATEGLTYELSTDGTYAICTSIGTATDTDIVIASKYEGVHVTQIKASAFEKCSTLTSVIVPDSVTSIGLSAFKGCTSLASITAPFVGATLNGTSNTHFGYIFGASSYSNNSSSVPSSLKTVVITSGTLINSYAFYYCRYITSVTLPSSVTSIGYYAFYNCSGLTSVTIPNSITSIGEKAFRDCRKLTTITIPDNVTSIGEEAFAWCDNLITVEFGANSQLTSIGEEAFWYCSKLTSITIPVSVTSIGKDAFSNCGKLIQYDNGVQYVDKWVIGSNASITNVILRSDTIGIAKNVFERKYTLTSITIPASMANINSNAFYECYKLVEVYNLSSLNITKSSYSNGYVGYYALNIYTPVNGVSKVTADENGYTFYADGDTCYLLGYTGSNTALTLPDNCNGKSYSIYRYAFYQNYNIKSITTPNGVTGIGDYAFQYCQSLSDFVISSSVISIGQHTFESCAALSSVKIEEGSKLTHIGSFAFNWCDNFTSIMIPDTVTSIGEYAFDYCGSLNSVYYRGNTSDFWDSISISSGNTPIKVATRYYYSETQPARGTGNYWHYIDGEIVVWEKYFHNDELDSLWDRLVDIIEKKYLSDADNPAVIIPNPKPGIYEHGSNFTNLIYSWDEVFPAKFDSESDYYIDWYMGEEYADITGCVGGDVVLPEGIKSIYGLACGNIIIPSTCTSADLYDFKQELYGKPDSTKDCNMEIIYSKSASVSMYLYSGNVPHLDKIIVRRGCGEDYKQNLMEYTDIIVETTEPGKLPNVGVLGIHDALIEYTGLSRTESDSKTPGWYLTGIAGCARYLSTGNITGTQLYLQDIVEILEQN